MHGTKHSLSYSPDLFSPYLSDLNPEHWIDSFPDLMWGLGFEMDCYSSYNALFQPADSHLPQTEIEDIILSNLSACPLQVVGNYIFSRFRELTHWCDYGYPSERVTYFFPRAFEILNKKYGEQQ